MKYTPYRQVMQHAIIAWKTTLHSPFFVNDHVSPTLQWTQGFSSEI
jgi:hypothetical protein